MAAETSLIIITLDRAALLQETLARLERQTRPVDEIVVVDNGPSAATAEAVENFRARLPVRRVEEARRGFGFARNRGLREAGGGILLFLDDDCYAEPDWVERLLAPLERGEAELAGGSRTCAREGLAARLDYLSTDAPVLHPRLPRAYVRNLSTSNFAMWRKVAEAVGPFDEALATCEDREFCMRARARGFRILYEPLARVAHNPPIRSFADYLSRMVRYGAGTTQYFLRHQEEEPLARLLPSSAALRLMLLPFLAGAGAGYLAWKNWPRRPDAVWLIPLLLVGQLYWHWGGYLAVRRERPAC